MVSRFERFTLAITEVDRYWHKIAADEMAKYELKGPYALYLVVLQRHPEGITATQLCELCDRNKADVSRAMAAMEKKGLVFRDSGSAYRARLLLTDAGRQAAERVCQLAHMAADIGGKGISVERREQFYETLEQIAANLRTISREGLPTQE